MLIGTFVLFGAAFYFISGVLNDRSAQVAAERQTIASRAYALQNLSSLKAANAQADLYMQKITAILPTQDALISFPDFLDNLAKVHNTSTNFSFNGPPTVAANKQPGFAAFNLTVSGQLSDIQQFLSDMELKAAKFLVNIDSVDISSGGGGYNANIVGKVYFQ